MLARWRSRRDNPVETLLMPGSGRLVRARFVEAGTDGSFEFRNVQPRTYQAIVLKSCKNCQQSSGMGAPTPVVVGTSDVTNLQLTVR